MYILVHWKNKRGKAFTVECYFSTTGDIALSSSDTQPWKSCSLHLYLDDILPVCTLLIGWKVHIASFWQASYGSRERRRAKQQGWPKLTKRCTVSKNITRSLFESLDNNKIIYIVYRRDTMLLPILPIFFLKKFKAMFCKMKFIYCASLH